MIEETYQDAPPGPSLRARMSGTWPVLVLAGGGVLTLVWSGFLVWTVAALIGWLIR